MPMEEEDSQIRAGKPYRSLEVILGAVLCLLFLLFILYIGNSTGRGFEYGPLIQNFHEIIGLLLVAAGVFFLPPAILVLLEPTKRRYSKSKMLSWPKEDRLYPFFLIPGLLAILFLLFLVKGTLDFNRFLLPVYVLLFSLLASFIVREKVQALCLYRAEATVKKVPFIQPVFETKTIQYLFALRVFLAVAIYFFLLKLV
ncbi:MAG: hypothetical protein Q7R47_04190 [Candidatus Diapherotrites archaeon]|nr:hypothetical protein [Candidatus Diapherotrites archaeon]